MQADIYNRIQGHPDFQKLVQKRKSFALRLSAVVLAMYFTFILLVAFVPGALAHPVASGTVVTWGIPVGVFIIISSFLLTGIYVKRANTEFDEENQRIIEECLRG